MNKNTDLNNDYVLVKLTWHKEKPMSWKLWLNNNYDC